VVISLYHFMQGIRLFRVHDVAAHRQAFRVAQQIRSLGSVDSLVAARRE
jgi:dihydropteroate synthase